MAGPKIAIVGSGANGSSIGADLVRAGHDVVLVEQWPEHVAAMRRHGVRIEMPGETVTVPVRVCHLCEVATFTERFDVVLILMKAYDTPWAVRLIEPYLKPGGLIAGVQNGMTTDAVAAAAGTHRTIGAVIEISSMMVDPGVVQRHSPPERSWFAVGSLDPITAGREAEIAALLRCSGTVETVADISSAKWMKLVSNSTTLVTTAILGLPLLAAAATPGMRELMLRAGQEALDTGTALGFAPLPIFGLKPADMARPERIVELLLDTLNAGFVLPETTTTILHDWRKGRHSEVDDINGQVVAHQERLGGRAPVNAAVVEIAHRIERGELKPEPGNLALLEDLAGRHVRPSSRLR
ncbi:MAG TPA: 2-dehydropantoate 2-reductase [Amycolatopsis sp.]|nr:2-dehydropantoate 2-reductase [Amycolatopsis sp.]